MNREQRLEELQNEALAELEKKRGEYDESSIVLYETSPVEARQLLLLVMKTYTILNLF